MSATRQSSLQDFFSIKKAVAAPKKEVKKETVVIDLDKDYDVAKPASQPLPKRVLSPPRRVAKVSRTSSMLMSGSFEGFDDDGPSSSDAYDTSIEVLNYSNDHLAAWAAQTTTNTSISTIHSQSIGRKRKYNDPQQPTQASDIEKAFAQLRRPRKKPPVQTREYRLPRGRPRKLTPEQEHVIDVVLSGQSVFYTGSAGTGKSVVLREIVRELSKIHGDNIGVCASTGMAACNIGGTTLHKFLHIGLGQGSASEIATRISKSRFGVAAWKKVKVLIIDEVSMVDGDLFDKLEEVARIVRKNHSPFGGIQIVCTGDFYQLPPVSSKKAKFCFQAKSWTRVITHKIILHQIFRQRDNELIEMLNALREGKVDGEMADKFYALSREVVYDDGVGPTELFPTRNEVHRANMVRLAALKGKEHKYEAADRFQNEFQAGQLENLMCVKQLVLKEDAQVMCIKNLDSTIVNGSVGKVLFFLPLNVWLKCQELFSDTEIVEMTEYIRLVAARLGNKQWTPTQHNEYQRVPPVFRTQIDILVALAVLDHEETLPIVDFKIPGGGRKLVRIERMDFSVDAPKSQSEPAKIARHQIPLLLAWAMSIHKAQGQSIERLRIDLTKIFELGQIYVALSRATNRATLEVYNFKPSKVRVSQEVISYYKEEESK
ncbi:ATP-dependent DNA helicase Rrm3p [Diutina catenulata]